MALTHYPWPLGARRSSPPRWRAVGAPRCRTPLLALRLESCAARAPVHRSVRLRRTAVWPTRGPAAQAVTGGLSPHACPRAPGPGRIESPISQLERRG